MYFNLEVYKKNGSTVYFVFLIKYDETKQIFDENIHFNDLSGWSRLDHVQLFVDDLRKWILNHENINTLLNDIRSKHPSDFFDENSYFVNKNRYVLLKNLEFGDNYSKAGEGI